MLLAFFLVALSFLDDLLEFHLLLLLVVALSHLSG